MAKVIKLYVSCIINVYQNCQVQLQNIYAKKF